jgi:DNA modification methylase
MVLFMTFQVLSTYVASARRVISDKRNVGIFWNGDITSEEIPKTKLFVTDPPYNIGIRYGKGVTDRKPTDEYHKMISDVLDECYEKAADDAHMFVIHYPSAIAGMWEHLTRKWDFRQWISWVYPTNTGHSKNRWTTAHRCIIWLTKGNPGFKNRGVTQSFKNRSVKVVKEKVSQGINGVALYDWWEIPQVKNVSEEYRNYENQIPSELIRRIVLCTTEPSDWVGDPFSGSFSTARTAMSLGRPAWGCDINPEVSIHWPTAEDWVHRAEDTVPANLDEGPVDAALIHITKERLQSAMEKLLLSATEDDLKRVIGPSNGTRVFNELRKGGKPN